MKEGALLPIASWFASAAPALAAVAAVFVAGVLAFFAAAWRERRRELNALMIAARIIGGEMDGAKMAVLQTIEDDDAGLPHALPSIGSFPATWEQHREVLAGHLPRDQWEVLDQAVHGLEYTLQLHTPEAAVDTTFADVAHALDSASTVLEGYAGEAGRWDNPGRKQKVPKTSTLGGVPTVADSSPIATAAPADRATPADGATPIDGAGSVEAAPPIDAAAPVEAAPPIGAAAPVEAAPPIGAAASIDGASPLDTAPASSSAGSERAVPPYLLGLGAAAVLSALVAGVLVSEHGPAASDLPSAVRHRARQTLAAQHRAQQTVLAAQHRAQQTVLAAQHRAQQTVLAAGERVRDKGASLPGSFPGMAQPSQLKRLRIRRGKAQPSQLARLRMSALARLPGR